MTEYFTCLWISKGIRHCPHLLTWSLRQLLQPSLLAVTQICYFPLIFPRCSNLLQSNNKERLELSESVYSCSTVLLLLLTCRSTAENTCIHLCCSQTPYVSCWNIILQYLLKEVPESPKSVFTPRLYTSWKIFSGSTLFPSISWNKILYSAVTLSAPHTPESSLHSRSPFPESRTGTAGVVLVSILWNLITGLVAFLCLFDMVL